MEAQSDMALMMERLRRAAESVLVVARWVKNSLTALNANTLPMRKGRDEGGDGGGALEAASEEPARTGMQETGDGEGSERAGEPET